MRIGIEDEVVDELETPHPLHANHVVLATHTRRVRRTVANPGVRASAPSHSQYHHDARVRSATVFSVNGSRAEID